MSLDLDYYIKYTKSNQQSNDLQEMSDRYSEQWDSAISSFDVVINSSRANTIYKDNIEYNCLVDFNRKNGKNDFTPTIYRELRTKLSDNFKSGDVIEFENSTSKEKNFYLLIKHVESKEGYDLFYMQECNIIFTYQDYDDNNKIITIPAINTSATLYSDGIEINKQIIQSDDLLNVLIPYSEYIFNFKLLRRFIFHNSDEDVYQLTMIDKSSYFNSIKKEGLLKLMLEKNQFNPITDRLDLNIADYRENTSLEPPTPSSDIQIQIQGMDTLRAMTDVGEYTAVVYQDGNVVDKKVIWSLSNDNAKILEFTDNTVTVQGQNQFTNFILTATLDEDNSITASKEIEILF